MATDVVMPQMGESIFEGTITKWLKKPGDKVERDEPLFEISTDKVDAEIPSPSAGVLKEIKVNEGQTVPIQTVVAVIDGAGAAAAAPAPAPAKAAAPAAPGAAAPAPPPAPRPAAPAPAAAAPTQAAPQAAAAPQRSGKRIHSSPLVRRMAAEHGIDLVGGSRNRARAGESANRISRRSSRRAELPLRRRRALQQQRPLGPRPPPPPRSVRGASASGGFWRTSARGVRIGGAARENVFRQLPSRADEQHAAAYRGAHGGFEARLAARLFGR